MSWKSCCIGVMAINLVVQTGSGGAQTEQAVKEPEAKAESKEVESKIKFFQLRHAQPSAIAQLLAIRRQRETTVVQSPGGNAFAEVRDVALLPENVHVAFEDSKRMLFVRGPVEAIRAIEKLVQALDVSADKLKQQRWENARIFPVRHGDAGSTQAVLSQLGFTTQFVTLGSANLIVASDAEEEEAEQIQEVIGALDEAAEATTTTVDPTTTPRGR
jgi:type II secretory pathway component GspD/PulD (secretin)